MYGRTRSTVRCAPLDFARLAASKTMKLVRSIDSIYGLPSAWASTALTIFLQWSTVVVVIIH
jgi:hypothetical protein